MQLTDVIAGIGVFCLFKCFPPKRRSSFGYKRVDIAKDITISLSATKIGLHCVHLFLCHRVLLMDLLTKSNRIE